MSSGPFGYCKVQKKVVPVSEIIRDTKPAKPYTESELAWLNRKVQRGSWKWDRVAKKLVPLNEPDMVVHAEAAHGFIQDEMPVTKHPVDGRYYTSKAKFRAVTRASGRVEVGDAYEKNINDPAFFQEQKAEPSREYKEKIHSTFKEILNNGYNREHRSR